MLFAAHITEKYWTAFFHLCDIIIKIILFWIDAEKLVHARVTSGPESRPVVFYHQADKKLREKPSVTQNVSDALKGATKRPDFSHISVSSLVSC